MTNQSISAIATQGMDFERSRLELATLKISLANVTFSSLLEAESFANSMRVDKNEMLQGDDSLKIKSLLDKQNPKADESGYVYKFDIDPTHEMASLVSATRAYEANVRAYNTNSQMNKSALEIGSK
jgi:flagellar basal-body rod protein FlgC